MFLNCRNKSLQIKSKYKCKDRKKYIYKKYDDIAQ